MEHLLTRECPKGPALTPESVRFGGRDEWFRVTCMLCPVVTGHHVIALTRDYLQSLVSLVARGTKGWSLEKSSLLHNAVNPSRIHPELVEG